MDLPVAAELETKEGGEDADQLRKRVAELEASLAAAFDDLSNALRAAEEEWTVAAERDAVTAADRSAAAAAERAATIATSRSAAVARRLAALQAENAGLLNRSRKDRKNISELESRLKVGFALTWPS